MKLEQKNPVEYVEKKTGTCKSKICSIFPGSSKITYITLVLQTPPGEDFGVERPSKPSR